MLVERLVLFLTAYLVGQIEEVATFFNNLDDSIHSDATQKVKSNIKHCSPKS